MRRSELAGPRGMNFARVHRAGAAGRASARGHDAKQQGVSLPDALCVLTARTLCVLLRFETPVDGGPPDATWPIDAADDAGIGADADASIGADADASIGADASTGADADASIGADADASLGADADATIGAGSSDASADATDSVTAALKRRPERLARPAPGTWARSERRRRSQQRSHRPHRRHVRDPLGRLSGRAWRGRGHARSARPRARSSMAPARSDIADTFGGDPIIRRMDDMTGTNWTR